MWQLGCMNLGRTATRRRGAVFCLAMRTLGFWVKPQGFWVKPQGLGMKTLGLCAVTLGLCVVMLGCEKEETATVKEVQSASPSLVTGARDPLIAAGQPAKKTQNEDPPPWAGRHTKDSGFPCEVENVLSASCRRCHWEPQENDAPFPLARWEHTRALRSGKEIHVLMKQMVAADLMPPLDALVEPDVTPLSAAQKQTLLDWLGAGAQKSTGECP